MSRRPETIIKQARERIDRIRQALGGIDHLCSGTLLQRTKVCGKPGCRCATDPNARHGPYYEWGHMRGGKLVPPLGHSRAGCFARTGHRQPPQGETAHAGMGRRNRKTHRRRSSANRTLTASQPQSEIRSI